MTLRPCTQCGRHFAAEPACPFCAAPATPAPPRVISARRVSRAAAFAALAGCYTSNPPPQYGPPPPPPPPVEESHEQDPDHDQFAEPPAGVKGTSRIEGTVTDGGTGQPAGGVLVTLQSRTPGVQPVSVHADPNGRYVFVDLPAGSYVLVFGYSNHPRRPPPQRPITLTDNDRQTVDMAIYTPPVSNVPMPYGAPPARTRIV